LTKLIFKVYFRLIFRLYFLKTKNWIFKKSTIAEKARNKRELLKFNKFLFNMLSQTSRLILCLCIGLCGIIKIKNQEQKHKYFLLVINCINLRSKVIINYKDKQLEIKDSNIIRSCRILSEGETIKFSYKWKVWCKGFWLFFRRTRLIIPIVTSSGKCNFCRGYNLGYLFVYRQWN